VSGRLPGARHHGTDGEDENGRSCLGARAMNTGPFNRAARAAERYTRSRPLPSRLVLMASQIAVGQSGPSVKWCAAIGRPGAAQRSKVMASILPYSRFQRTGSGTSCGGRLHAQCRL